jgi:hypothetical protein
MANKKHFGKPNIISRILKAVDEMDAERDLQNRNRLLTFLLHPFKFTHYSYYNSALYPGVLTLLFIYLFILEKHEVVN